MAFHVVTFRASGAPICRNGDMPETIKDNVIEMIRRMPDDATVPDIMAELYVRQKIDVGLKQLDEGQSLSQEEVEQRLNKWLRWSPQVTIGI